MSDRVAIIGGETEGWDHFPFAVTEDNESDLTKEGFSGDLNRMSRLFWVVKKWRVTAYLELLTDGGSDILDIEADFDVTDALIYSDDYQITREADLVLGQSLIWSASDGDNSLIVTFNPNFLTKQEGDNFFFPVIIHAFNESNETTLQNTGRDLEEGGPVPDTSTDPDTSVNFGGCENFAYYYLAGRTLSALQLSMAPIEYWPYATKAGLPVYDTSDGSVLNDPLS